ncbi:hypothetical protein GCM10009834_26420 [Streptomonospora arabica]
MIALQCLRPASCAPRGAERLRCPPEGAAARAMLASQRTSPGRAGFHLADTAGWTGADTPGWQRSHPRPVAAGRPGRAPLVPDYDKALP